MRKVARCFILAGVATFAVAVGIGTSTGSALAASFDGLWSVLVVTESGTCDRAYRYPVRVVNGRVIYSGEASVDVSGRVDPGGRVRVSIGRGDQSAIGSGRLGHDSGSGTWRGRSPSAACTGSWTAERR